ncbi:DJ-1/PfpI/YhbO family deglycase/protease [Corynebacterium pacaense]|uniref:DJ-1/PfpI/YhbO family deglycase/protease n=1 Tax=Corynebacterium pacaense TaxID=1816684 RepID=UPI0009BC543D|nr:DJ-1/PfpI/YhbO family deglycase/protease [Corynebacterium pacaense]
MSKKILVVSTEFGTERDEIVVPVQKLRALGHEVTVATPSGGEVQTVLGDKDWDVTVPADRALNGVPGDEFDVILLPGGTVNSDQTRINEDIRALLRAQASAGRAIAAICHAPWSLIDAGIARDKNLTSYISVKLDLENAGAHWVDQSVKVCGAGGWTLITSRNPGDLEDFIHAIDAA